MRVNTMKHNEKTWKIDYFEPLLQEDCDEQNEVNEINEESV